MIALIVFMIEKTKKWKKKKNLIEWYILT